MNDKVICLNFSSIQFTVLQYLPHPDKQYADVVHDLNPHALVRVGHL